MAADLYLREVDVLRFEVNIHTRLLTGRHLDSKASRGGREGGRGLGGWGWVQGGLMAVAHDRRETIAIAIFGGGGMTVTCWGLGVF